MKIPDSIRIGGIDYEVKLVNEHIIDKDHQGLYGQCDYNNSEITINNKAAQSKQHHMQTLWHEILHGIANHACLDYESASEEMIVDVFAKGIVQVLQDNVRKLYDIEDKTDYQEIADKACECEYIHIGEKQYIIEFEEGSKRGKLTEC